MGEALNLCASDGLMTLSGMASASLLAGRRTGIGRLVSFLDFFSSRGNCICNLV